MKRIIIVCFCLFCLVGCGKTQEQMDRALGFRQNFLKQAGCRFDCRLTADYGDILYQFSLSCEVEDKGVVAFCVTQPETIAGISGTISGSGGNIVFDDTVLGFPILSESLPTPLSTPWLFITALRSGYIRSCDVNDGAMSLTVADTYEDDAIVLHITFSESDEPLNCEVIWQGRRILSMEIISFSYL